MKTKAKDRKPRAKAPAIALPIAPTVGAVTNTFSAVRTMSEKGIVFAVSLSCFSGSRKDETESKKVAASTGAAAGSARVWKSLLRHPELSAAMTAAQHVRGEFYRLSMPWDADGKRIVPIAKATETKLALEKLKAAFLDAAAKAVAAFPAMVLKDQANAGGLGTMFNPADYPSQAEFASRFSCEIKLQPVRSDDFRSGILSPSEVLEINQSIAEEAARLTKDANRDLLVRMRDALQRIADNASEGKGVYSKTFANVVKACDEADALNIAGDAGISALSATLRETFKDSETLADLFTSEAGAKAIASDTAAKLADIEAQMAAFA